MTAWIQELEQCREWLPHAPETSAAGGTNEIADNRIHSIRGAHAGVASPRMQEAIDDDARFLYAFLRAICSKNALPIA